MASSCCHHSIVPCHEEAMEACKLCVPAVFRVASSRSFLAQDFAYSLLIPTLHNGSQYDMCSIVLAYSTANWRQQIFAIHSRCRLMVLAHIRQLSLCIRTVNQCSRSPWISCSRVIGTSWRSCFACRSQIPASSSNRKLTTLIRRDICSKDGTVSFVKCVHKECNIYEIVPLRLSSWYRCESKKQIF